MRLHQIEGLTKRKKKRVFGWSIPLPTIPETNSAFLYKLGGACLGRSLMFEKGDVKESPVLNQYAKISKRALIVNFAIMTIGSDDNLTDGAYTLY